MNMGVVVYCIFPSFRYVKRQGFKRITRQIGAIIFHVKYRWGTSGKEFCRCNMFPFKNNIWLKITCKITFLFCYIFILFSKTAIGINFKTWLLHFPSVLNAGILTSKGLKNNIVQENIPFELKSTYFLKAITI